MITNYVNLFNFILFISLLCIFIKTCFVYNRVFSKVDSYFINPMTKKDIQKLTLFKFLSPVLQLLILSFFQLIIFFCINKFDSSDIKSTYFLNIVVSYFLIYAFNISISINKNYIYRNFKLIKKSDIDYLNLDYKNHILKIYLKEKKKPILIVFKNELSNFAKILNELEYGELLTRKNF